jgi:hypothetical protein
MVLNHWSAVPAAHRRWIVINSVLIAAVWNVAINGIGALLASHGKHHVPLWSTPVIGGPSLIVNSIETLFFLPFSTCLGVSAAVRKAQTQGKLTKLQTHERGPLWLSTLPASPWRRAVKVGVTVVLVGGPVLISILAIGFGAGISPSDYVIYNALLGLLLGLTVTSYIALAAMGHYDVDTNGHSKRWRSGAVARGSR